MNALSYTITGTLLLGHFCFTVWYSLFNHEPANLIWISHVATLCGGLGALFKNRFLIGLALVSLFEHHLFWCVDAVGWLLTGHFPLGLTTYLQQASLLEWLRSINHFFSVPLLCILAVDQGRMDRRLWLAASALFTLLVFTSYSLFLPEANINCAHMPCAGTKDFFMLLPATAATASIIHPILTVAANVFLNYLPVNLLLAFLIPKIHAGAVHYARKPG